MKILQNTATVIHDGTGTYVLKQLSCRSDRSYCVNFVIICRWYRRSISQNPPDGLISRRCNLSFCSGFVTANALKRTSTYPLIYIYSLFHFPISLAFFYPRHVFLSSFFVISDPIVCPLLTWFSPTVVATSSSSTNTPLFLLKMIRFNERKKSTERTLRFIRCHN